MKIPLFIAFIICLPTTESMAKKIGRFDTEERPAFCIQPLSEKDLIDTLEEARQSGCIDGDEYVFLKSRYYTPICALKRNTDKAALMMYCR